MTGAVKQLLSGRTEHPPSAKDPPPLPPSLAARQPGEVHARVGGSSPAFLCAPAAGAAATPLPCVCVCVINEKARHFHATSFFIQLGHALTFLFCFFSRNVVEFRFLLFFLRELDRAGQPARVGGSLYIFVVSGFTEKSSQLVNTLTHIVYNRFLLLLFLD